MSETMKNNSSSSKPKRGGSKRKYPRPHEAGSKFMVLGDQGNDNNNHHPPPLLPPPPPPPVAVGATATTRSGNDVVTVGQSFSGITDGSSNSPILKGVDFNPETHASAETVLGESHPPYSSSSSSSSSSQVERMVAKPSESSSSGTGVKVVPVVFEPTTDLFRLRKGKGIPGNFTRNKDSLLNRPSPAIRIPPSYYLLNEGPSAGCKFTPLPDMGRETPTVGGEFGRDFKEAAEVFNEKISQLVLSQETQQIFRKKD